MTRDVLAVEYNDCNVVIQLMNLSHQWLAFRHDNESSLQALSSVWSWSFVYEVVKKLKIFRYSDMEENNVFMITTNLTCRLNFCSGFFYFSPMYFPVMSGWVTTSRLIMLTTSPFRVS